MKTRLSLFILIWILGLSALQAADFWKKKPYTEWSGKDCQKLLEDSPWSYGYALTGVNIPGMMDFERNSHTTGRSYGDTNLDSQLGDREVHLYLQIRFLTARPVKAAIGQLRLLADNKNSDLKKQVDQYVNQAENSEIIIEITSYSRPAGHAALRQIDGFLRTSTLAALHNRIWLSNSAEDIHVPIQRYQAPSDNYNGALLFFPRYDENGNSYFDGMEKQILFRMEVDFGEVNLTLKPKKMKFENDFTF